MMKTETTTIDALREAMIAAERRGNNLMSAWIMAFGSPNAEHLDAELRAAQVVAREAREAWTTAYDVAEHETEA